VKKFILAFIFGALFVASISVANAQQTYICIKTGSGCQIVDATHPLPVGATISGTVTVTGDVTVTGGTVTANVVNPSIISSQSTPTVTAGAYSSGYSLGGLLTLANVVAANGNQVFIQSATVAFKSGAIPAMDVIFFNANPTSSTITDNQAIAVNSADLGKIVGVAHIADCTLAAASTESVCQAQNLVIPAVLSTTSLYAAVVVRASVTPGSTSDVIATIRSVRN
jgi:hypothetical protein